MNSPNFIEEAGMTEEQNILFIQTMQQQYEHEVATIAKASPDAFIDAFVMADRSEIAANIIDRVESGNIPALKALTAIKALESLAEILTNKDPKKNRHADKAILLQSLVGDDIAKQPEKKFSMYGASFTKTEVGTKYDWSQCNDPKLIELELAAKAASEALNTRQEFLKTVPASKIAAGKEEGGLLIVEQETGETYRIYPPSKTSTSSISVSFK